MVHISPHAQDMGFSTVQAALLVSIIGAASIAGRIFMGVTSDKLGIKHTATVCLVMLVIALGLLQIESTTRILFVSAALYGFGHGGVYTIISPYVAELFGKRSHGSIFGVVILAGSIGGAIGPVSAGLLYDIIGNYHLVFLILAFLMIMSLVLNHVLQPVSNKELIYENEK